MTLKINEHTDAAAKLLAKTAKVDLANKHVDFTEEAWLAELARHGQTAENFAGCQAAAKTMVAAVPLALGRLTEEQRKTNPELTRTTGRLVMSGAGIDALYHHQREVPTGQGVETEMIMGDIEVNYTVHGGDAESCLASVRNHLTELARLTA